MNFKIIIYIFILCFLNAEVFDGLTLLSDEGDEETGTSMTHLIDNDGTVINQWYHDTFLSGIAYLSSDSILYAPCKINNPNGPTPNGRLKKMNWDGDIIWDFVIPQDVCRPHHDIEVMPNGNILVICSELKTYEELLSFGMLIEEEPNINSNRGNLDMVVEIEPINSNQGNIVWKWHFWDHLIQDIDSNIPNYGSVSDNPQLLNINSKPLSFLMDEEHLPGADADDWMHCNSITYNEDLDQIVLSSRHRSEIYIIDHSTTIEEAASHNGGIYGMGGDFLYRWGNPQNYNLGDNSNQILAGQHSAVWIPVGSPGEGNIILFNNMHTSTNSAVFEIITPVIENGFYNLGLDGTYGPDSYNWIYEIDEFSPVRSGVMRLPNGNTIITTNQSTFEINDEFQIVWTYEGNLSPTRVVKYGYDFFDSLFGDLNNDGVINVLDIIFIVNIILTNGNNDNADLNSDGSVNVVDVIQLINIILN